MTLPDVNVWLALTLSGHSHHAVARAWFDAKTETESVLFCRATQQAYLRLLSTQAVLAPFGLPPRTNREAWDLFARLTADERVGWISEPTGVEVQWRTWAAREAASPKFWTDAWLAATAHCAGLRLVTIDREFAQFAGLDALILDSETRKNA